MSRTPGFSLAAVLALVALGTMPASAYAADEGHCSVESCRLTVKPDGTGKTAHHIIIVENATKTEAASFTCSKISGQGSANTKTFLLTRYAISYEECTVNGSAGTEVAMNGCEYEFGSAGGTTDTAKLKVVCPAGKKIEFKYNGCALSIAGGFEATGLGYQTSGEAPSREITVTVNQVPIPSANISATGTKAQCLINPAQALTGTYTTGNTLLTGETAAGVMADAWYE